MILPFTFVRIDEGEGYLAIHRVDYLDLCDGRDGDILLSAALGGWRDISDALRICKRLGIPVEDRTLRTQE